ncbi:LysR family transcriptional regulator [Curvivirga sp.]|uniref:LysR family transcriptional regulator n=1 Tax=Curvivirga sp. TaxID=2856848 RepID=UPI003B5C5B5A
MNYFRRTLPSLDALVYFEAAARHLNFTKAADELNVSQVAVSKRIRILEEDLDTTLFQRDSKKISLTEDGLKLAEQIPAALAFIEEAVNNTRNKTDSKRKVIQIVADENVIFFWLNDLVRQYQLEGHEALISVITSNNVNDPIWEEADLAIFFGSAPPTGWNGQMLFREALTPVAKPGIDPKTLPLLNYEKEVPNCFNWLNFMDNDLWLDLKQNPIQDCASYIQSISLALKGEGIALAERALLQKELASNQLTPVSPDTQETEECYFLTTPANRPTFKEITDLISFLTSNA